MEREPTLASLADPTRWLTEGDLDFIVRATSSRRTDYDRIREIVRDKPDILEILLEDERLYQRIVEDDHILLKISPRLLFTVLLRRVRRQLKDRSFTVEGGPSGRLPVFDARQAARLVEDPQVLAYLADMLASFVRTESRSMVIRRGGSYYRRVFSDMDVDDLLAMVELVDPAQRFGLYKRIADVCLFLVGMFPEHVDRAAARPARLPWEQARVRFAGRLRSRSDYERLGRDFYQKAAEDQRAERTGLAAVLTTIGDHFTLASKPLNVLADQLIPLRRWSWFHLSGEVPAR